VLKRIDWKEPGFPLSIALHLFAVAWGLFAFSSPPPFDAASEAIPVEVVSDVSEMTRGSKKAEKVLPNTPEQVDKVADLRKENDPGQDKTDTASIKPPTKQEETVKDEPAKVEPPQAAQPPIPTPPARSEPPQQASQPPVPTPPAKPVRTASAEDDPDDNREAEIIREQHKKDLQKKAEEAQKLAEQKKAEEARKLAEQKKAEEARKLAEQKKQLAERIAAEQAKAEAEAKLKAEKLAEQRKKEAEAKAKAVAAAKKAAEEKKRQEAAEKAPAFDPNAIRNKLLASHERPTSSGSTGAQVSRTPSLGTRTASGARLSPSDREALIGMIGDQIRRCWNLTVTSAPSVKPVVHIELAANGELVAAPRLTNSSGEPNFRAVAESGMRAIRQCSPYRIPAKYAQYFDDWKNINVRLDPSDLL
jgi:colicin import membrane protein